MIDQVQSARAATSDARLHQQWHGTAALFRPLTALLARRPTLVVLLAVAAGIGASNATAFEPSRSEFYIYPPYCKAKMADLPQNRQGRWRERFHINEQQIAYWRPRIGPDWANLDDFCAGLTYLSRANDPSWLRQAKTSAKAQFREAAQLIGRVRERSAPQNPFWQELTLRYAEAAGGAGNYGSAMQELDKLLKRDPRNADIYLMQAKLTERRGELNKAISYLEAGLQAGAQPGPILFHLANDYYKLGDFERAREYMAAAERAGMKMDRLKSRLSQ
jgi:tetratricopeptide (TPR) repeat protein